MVYEYTSTEYYPPLLGRLLVLTVLHVGRIVWNLDVVKIISIVERPQGAQISYMVKDGVIDTIVVVDPLDDIVDKLSSPPTGRTKNP